jgi:hypothetical protein
MNYYITEHATYEVEADSPKAALEKFKSELKAPFPTDVDYRDICNEDGDDLTEEAEDQ